MIKKRENFEHTVAFDPGGIWIDELKKVFAKIKVDDILCIVYAHYETERVKMLVQATLLAKARTESVGSTIKFDMWPYGNAIMVRCLKK